MDKSFVGSLGEIGYEGIWRLGRWLRKYTQVIALTAIALAVLLALWSVTGARDLVVRKVIVYTGEPGGQSHKYGVALQKHFNERSGWHMIDYEIELRPSAGLVENRMRVSEGGGRETIIGFDQDGFVNSATAANVKTLVPLSDMFLHIIAYKPLLKASFPPGPSPPGHQPTFREFTDKVRGKLGPDDVGPQGTLKRLKCYLGLKGSGTRLIAETVVRHHGINPAEVDVGNFMGWDHAYEMLNRGEIDIVFDGTDKGSDEIRREANFTLIGLDSGSGLVAGNPSSGLREATIPANTYVGKGAGFNSVEIQTVSIRRLITCNDSMSAFDAFHIAQGVEASHPQLQIRERYNKQAKIPDGTALLLQTHPGAVDFKDGNSPLFYRTVENYWQIVFPFIGGVILIFLRKIGLFGSSERYPAAGPITAVNPQPPGPPTPPPTGNSPPVQPPAPTPLPTPPELLKAIDSAEDLERDVRDLPVDVSPRVVKALLGGIQNAISKAINLRELPPDFQPRVAELLGKLGEVKTKLWARFPDTDRADPGTPSVPTGK